MDSNTSKTVVKGKYYWKLLFHYDNSGNTSSITRKIIKKYKETINSKGFMSTKFNATAGFKYQNESSISLKYEGLADASSKSTYDFHTDLAYELVKTSELAKETITETEESEEYQIGPGGKLELYQLCFASDYMSKDTDVVSTSKLFGEELIEMLFICEKQIIGLPEILNIFSHTFPGSSNTTEWEAIRNSIVKYSDKPNDDQFRHFVETLHIITPKSENTVEWAAIRETCQEILDAWQDSDKILLFKKLLTRFSTTVPGRSNRVEWERIRETSDKLLKGIIQIY